jgi:hypothetical protein
MTIALGWKTSNADTSRAPKDDPCRSFLMFGTVFVSWRVKRKKSLRLTVKKSLDFNQFKEDKK